MDNFYFLGEIHEVFVGGLKMIKTDYIFWAWVNVVIVIVIVKAVFWLAHLFYQREYFLFSLTLLLLKYSTIWDEMS